MKIFISWSGDVSQRVALVLRDWLPSVLQCVTPYVSSEDIDKGARWSTDIAAELSGSSFGILCVTRDNVQAPWLNFEAGALSKAFDKSRVCPFLVGMKRTELKGPLLQFQSTVYDANDVKKLVRSINAAADDDCLDEVRVDGSVDVWWPRLQKALDPLEALPVPAPSAPEAAPSHVTEMIEEILELTRGQQKVLSDPRVLLPPEYFEYAMRNLMGIPRDTRAWREFEFLLVRAEHAAAEAHGKGDSKASDLLVILQELSRAGQFLIHRAGPRRRTHIGMAPDRPIEEGK